MLKRRNGEQFEVDEAHDAKLVHLNNETIHLEVHF